MEAHRVEENLDRLVRQLSELGFPKTNMYEYLSGCLELEKIPIYHRVRTGDEEMAYEAEIKKDADGLHRLTGYHASLLQTHPVPHGLFMVMDTKDLEERMRSADWQRALHQLTREPFTALIIDQIMTLSAAGGHGADIARRLQLRYWLHTPMEHGVNVAKHYDAYARKVYFPLEGGLSDISAREAYNLMCGRAVLKFHLGADEPNTIIAQWKILENGKLQTLPDYDIGSELRSLRVIEATQDNTGPKLIYDLIRGERPRVHIMHQGTKVTLYAEADPQNASLRLFDKQMNRIDIQKLPRQSAGKSFKKRPGKNRGRSL